MGHESGGAQEGVGLGVGADGDAQIVFGFGGREPADQDFSGAEFLQPDFGGEVWRAHEDEIGLAGQNGESHF